MSLFAPQVQNTSGSATFHQPNQNIPDNLIFRVGNVEFKMIHVDGGTFYIGETPVTQALWKEVMGTNPSHFKKGDQRPVESVSWNACQDFIKKLNARTGKEFRLPTEAEWDFAACGGNKSKGYEYPGSNNIDEVAWYEENSYKTGRTSPNYGTHAVKTKKPNELGIYDMAGNVWEWCQDKVRGSERECRSFRGGSWADSAYVFSLRSGYYPDKFVNTIGFRLTLSE